MDQGRFEKAVRSYWDVRSEQQRRQRDAGKTQVGPSFGNNFNNRSEEAIGSASDVWIAYREGRFGDTRPWLGYFFLLEEHPKSTKPVVVREPLFDTGPRPRRSARHLGPLRKQPVVEAMAGPRSSPI